MDNLASSHTIINMALNHETPFDTDLNVDFSCPKIDDEDTQQQNVTNVCPHLPDLNESVAESCEQSRMMQRINKEN